MVRSLDRSGVLVIRAWIEPATGSLRARISRVSGLIGRERTVTSSSSADEILNIVRDWLDTISSDEHNGPT